MLESLHIENIALIDHLDIHFTAGLNILSGETGAGKSIIIDSVNLVLGERADKDIIKSGTERALVEAVFDISAYERILSFFESLGFQNDEKRIILSREIHVSGKGGCRINGRVVTVSALKQAGDALVDLHGQHEHQSLLKPPKHLELIDIFAGEELLQLRDKVSALYKEYHAIDHRLKTRFGSERDRERMMDILSFQIREIEHAKLQKGEDELLQQERLLLLNGEKISRALNDSYDAIYTGRGNASALQSVKEAASSMSSLTGIDDMFLALRKRLDEVYYTLEDIAVEMRDFKNSFDFDSARLEETERRLDEIARLKKKYGETLPDILSFLEKARSELDDITGSEEQIKALEEKRLALGIQMYDRMKDLSLRRRQAAENFSASVLEQLADLGLGRSRFEPVFSEIPGYDEAFQNAAMLTSKGFDVMEFYISTNIGEPVKPLSKVASGGEMSRIMLAIKNISADLDEIPSMIFDEIDTGISGKMAQVVAQKLCSISLDRQVVCVTHLPQLAAMADSHYLISKHETAGRMLTTVALLEGMDRMEEVARLAGGTQISSVGIAHATEMVRWAQAYKISLEKPFVSD